MASRKQPQIVLLKEGTVTSQGKAQLVRNINACTAVGDKGSITISNDGAKILADITKSQDSEVGDGTATVLLSANDCKTE
ncbi:hypothetical protein AALP_AA3G126300 [Arabis alpina]|uniref:Uncharacterized protein n=1 Tax=Arabis alpina TaxID=50452 RepID=A0A087H8T1_ARAAL|nr:hypothetical protein AALP_AA3G126300 [Arabis alpina]